MVKNRRESVRWQECEEWIQWCRWQNGRTPEVYANLRQLMQKADAGQGRLRAGHAAERSQEKTGGQGKLLEIEGCLRNVPEK